MLVKTTITEKLVTYFLLLNITAVLIVGFLSYMNSKDAINQRTFDQLTSVKFSKKRQVENFFRDRINEVKFFSQLEPVTGYLNNSMIKSSDLSARIASIDKIFNNYRYYKSLLILNEDGTSISFPAESGEREKAVYDSVINPLNLANNRKNFRGIEIIELKNAENIQPYSIYFAYKVLSDKKNLLGTIIFEIDIDYINSIMLETNPNEGLGKTGESYIIGSDKYMRTNSRFFKNAIFNKKINTEGAYNAIEGHDSILIYKDYRNIDVLGSYGRLDIPGINWYILAEIDLEESNLPIVKNRNNIIILTLLIAVIVFALTYFLSRKITIPIVRLTEATNRIAKGNYNEYVEMNSSDEIGVLTSTFNDMAKILKAQEEEIEKERIKRSQAAIEAMESERLRLSRELHDGLGQTLISQKLKLENIDPDKIVKSVYILDDVKASIDMTINEIRHICNDLMPAVLFEFGLVNAIRKLCKDLNVFSNIEIIFISDFHLVQIDDKLKIYLFRITQESLKNAIEHSKSTKCIVELKNTEKKIMLRIIDNGTGFKQESVQKGNGLINIRERVNLLHGEFKIKSDIDNGTELIINIPAGDGDGKN